MDWSGVCGIPAEVADESAAEIDDGVVVDSGMVEDKADGVMSVGCGDWKTRKRSSPAEKISNSDIDLDLLQRIITKTIQVALTISISMQ